MRKGGNPQKRVSHCRWMRSAGHQKTSSDRLARQSHLQIVFLFNASTNPCKLSIHRFGVNHVPLRRKRGQPDRMRHLREMLTGPPVWLLTRRCSHSFAKPYNGCLPAYTRMIQSGNEMVYHLTTVAVGVTRNGDSNGCTGRHRLMLWSR